VALALLVGIPASGSGSVLRDRYAGAIADTLHHRREYLLDDLFDPGSGLRVYQLAPAIISSSRYPSHHRGGLHTGQFQLVGIMAIREEEDAAESLESAR